MCLVFSNWNIEWLIIFINYSVVVELSEVISGVYYHLRAHHKLLMHYPRSEVAPSSPSSSRKSCKQHVLVLPLTSGDPYQGGKQWENGRQFRNKQISFNMEAYTNKQSHLDLGGMHRILGATPHPVRCAAMVWYLETEYTVSIAADLQLSALVGRIITFMLYSNLYLYTLSGLSVGSSG